MLTRRYVILFVLLATLPVCSQIQDEVANDAGGKMVTPTPVSGEGYSMDFNSETPRTNYVRGGLTFNSAYDDNVMLSAGHPVSDVNYSVWPFIALDQSRSRLSWDLSYSPGFTFYQKTTSLNQADHNFGLTAQYRLSPHVTLRLQDRFTKTSNFFNQVDQNSPASVSGALQNPNESIVAPIAERISNAGNVQISYQFSPNGMIGVTGNFYELRYPNRAQTPGLFNSDAKGGGFFYTHRLSGRHYIGATYQFQDFLAHPSNFETQTHSMLLFYTLYLQPTMSVSVFGGPEYSDTQGGKLNPLRQWSSAEGGSFGWQGAHTSFAASVARRISEGGGLPVSVRSKSGDASVRRQLTRKLTATLGASYATNEILILATRNGGHTVSGNVSLGGPLIERLGFDIGYGRLHQSYANIPAISNAPDRNRFWVSLSYRFGRPLGR